MIAGNAASNGLAGGAGADTFVLNNRSAVDAVDKLALSQAGIRVGDGDLLIENATTVAGPGGFAPNAELVVVTGNIAGAITATSAAAKIGAANAVYAMLANAVFAVHNGVQTSLFLFTSSGNDATRPS